MTTSTHFLQIEGGGYGAPTVICTAGPGAPCHIACDSCEVSCSCDEPTLCDIGECNQVLFLNNDDNDLMEVGEGVALLPIDLKWEGDYYSWSFVKPVTA